MVIAIPDTYVPYYFASIVETFSNGSSYQSANTVGQLPFFNPFQVNWLEFYDNGNTESGTSAYSNGLYCALNLQQSDNGYNIATSFDKSLSNGCGGYNLSWLNSYYSTSHISQQSEGTKT